MKIKVFIAIPVSSGELPPLYKRVGIRYESEPESEYDYMESFGTLTREGWRGDLNKYPKVTHWLKETEVNLPTPEEEINKLEDAFEAGQRYGVDEHLYQQMFTDKIKEPDCEQYINSLLNK